MTLPLTKETLAAAYDYLLTTPPFNEWHLPDSGDIDWHISRSHSHCGTANYQPATGRVRIEISSYRTRRTQSLMELMAHEMLHILEWKNGIHTKAEHSKGFHKLADKVCLIHGFDRGLF